MQGWNRILILFVLSQLIFPTAAFSQGNIYREVIPHLKACISLIKERETAQTTSQNKRFDLREVCPTLIYFLSYEPISEIDPPLENQSERAYLESLVTLLESTYRTRSEHSTKQLVDSPANYAVEKEPDKKPFLMAMSQWLFSRVYQWLGKSADSMSPGLLHYIDIAVLNMVIVCLCTIVLLYLITSARGSQLYFRHFRYRWQNAPEPEQIISLNGITRLHLNAQIPALLKLIKHELNSGNIIHIDANAGNAEYINIINEQKPEIAREFIRLIRFHDRVKFGRKKPAADEINQAFRLARKILETIKVK